MARHAVGARGHEEADELFCRPALAAVRVCKPIEELRVTWPFAERAKVIHRGDEALAKEVMPNAVHHHPGQEGIGRLEDALGQLEAPTTFPHRGLVRSGQRFEKAARHLLPQLSGLASDEDLLIDAGALGHCRNARWLRDRALDLPVLLEERLEALHRFA